LGLNVIFGPAEVVAACDLDVMLEAKAKDLAVLGLRPDLLRYAPDVAEDRSGIRPNEIDGLKNKEDFAIETG